MSVNKKNMFKIFAQCGEHLPDLSLPKKRPDMVRNLYPGSSNKRERLSTVALHVRVACFVKR
jgi:hypothetical protein